MIVHELENSTSAHTTRPEVTRERQSNLPFRHVKETKESSDHSSVRTSSLFTQSSS